MATMCTLIFALFLAISTYAAPNTKPLKNGGQHWALLVAGSNGYDNYRHQADVCHAYQVLRDHGVPEANIVVMMYDDIAYADENPTKGIIINRPNGHDVYKGVKIDYKGDDVNPANFLAVLTGNKEKVAKIGTGRVIGSGPNDHVFVNFVDHGAPGLIAFPDQELHAKPLMNALLSMHTKKQFAQLVFYLEACESGSMFNKLLPKNVNIFATTAANPTESSYATYYDDERQTYLGDLYSVMWMEDSDVEKLDTFSLADQFKKVKQETNLSHVMEYGDLSIAKEPVGDFQGNTPSDRNIYYPKIKRDAVRTQDVELHVLYHKIEASNSEAERESLERKLSDKLKYRDAVAAEMKNIISVALNHDHMQVANIMSTRSEDINFDCYETAVKHYSANCNKINSSSYALRMLYALQNFCNRSDASVGTLMSAMDKVCLK